MGIIESVQQYDLNIPAGGAQNVDVAGDRVQFLSATDPFAQIEIRPNYAQGNISLKPGQGFKFAQQVQRWVVFNRGNVPLTGYLLIGSGDFFDQRIAGTVDVIDGGKARTLGGLAFIGAAYQALVGGQLAMVQLWNPAGSGKNLIVESYVMGGSVNQGAFQFWYTASLASLVMQGQSKLVGGTAAVGQVRATNNAADLGTAMGQVYTQAAASLVFKPSEPIVIRPGYGVHFRGGLGQDMQVQYEWYEENA